MLKKHGLKALAAAALLMVPTAPAAADILVIRALGKVAQRYPTGRRFPDATRFRLERGESLAILFGGRTRVFSGPGSFTAADPVRAPTQTSAIVRIGAGAVRGPFGTVPTDPWHIDIYSPGPICFSPGRPLSFWRADAKAADTLTVRPAEGGAAQTLRWPAEQSVVPWPARLSPTPGASYDLALQGQTRPTRIRIAALPATATQSLESLAEAMLAARCVTQLDALITANLVSPAPSQSAR